jgi:hypothetical protein
VVVPPLSGVTLAPGETYVVAHQNSTVADLADEMYSTSLANDGFGVWLENDERDLIDAVSVHNAAEEGECGAALPNSLDFARAQSYQRVGVTGDVSVDFIKAHRTPGAPNATEPDPGVQPSDVLVSELANGGPGGNNDDFIELANYGVGVVDVSGWRIYRCTAEGRRLTTTLQATIPDGVRWDRARSSWRHVPRWTCLPASTTFGTT